MDAVGPERLVVHQQSTPTQWTQAWVEREGRRFVGWGRDPSEALMALRLVLRERYPEEAWPWSRFRVEA